MATGAKLEKLNGKMWLLANNFEAYDEFSFRIKRRYFLQK